MNTAPALELREIQKHFGPIRAVAGATVSVDPGTVHVLLGENGAGKTTLLRIAAGFVHQDAGDVLVNGVVVRWASRAAALRAGVGSVEQHFSLVPAMTVAENVSLGTGSPLSRFSPRAAAERVERIAAAAGLRVDPHALVESLPVAAQQRAEIVKALALNATLLILDEPTAVLTPVESDDLFAWIRAFASTGRTAVVITHRIREALQHGDALTVLREGRTVLRASRGQLSRNDLVSAIMGEHAAASPVRTLPGSREHDDQPVATLQGVSVVDDTGRFRLRDVSVAIRRGEIVGVAGVEGAGQRELLRVLAGRLTPTAGFASLPTTIGFVPEDRLRDALVGELTLTQNFVIRGLGARSGTVDWPAEEARAGEAISALSVRAHGANQLAGTLSGGNQQKFVLARELGDRAPLIVAENPTRGLDVRAAADVIGQLSAARASGSSVVVYSSDMEDLIGFVDRMLVCYDGVAHEVAPEFDAIGRAMVGAG